MGALTELTDDDLRVPSDAIAEPDSASGSLCCFCSSNRRGGAGLLHRRVSLLAPFGFASPWGRRDATVAGVGRHLVGAYGIPPYGMHRLQAAGISRVTIARACDGFRKTSGNGSLASSGRPPTPS